MARTKLDLDVIASLGRRIGAEAKGEEKEESFEPWQPSLTPTQQKIFDSTAPYILAYGERASGKSTIGVHKAVRHAYENFNAEVLFIVGVRSQATQGGIFTKLELEVLPLWTQGMGLEWEPSKRDPQQQLYIHIKNVHGSWSRIVLMSAPHAPTLKNKIRGCPCQRYHFTRFQRKRRTFLKNSPFPCIFKRTASDFTLLKTQIRKDSPLIAWRRIAS